MMGGRGGGGGKGKMRGGRIKMVAGKRVGGKYQTDGRTWCLGAKQNHANDLLVGWMDECLYMVCIVYYIDQHMQQIITEMMVVCRIIHYS